jgi:hypothetical protein
VFVYTRAAHTFIIFMQRQILLARHAETETRGGGTSETLARTQRAHLAPLALCARGTHTERDVLVCFRESAHVFVAFA